MFGALRRRKGQEDRGDVDKVFTFLYLSLLMLHLAQSLLLCGVGVLIKDWF